MQEALAAGENSADIVHAIQDGLRVVGERYEQQEIFLSGLIMAGEIFRGVMDMVLPDWESTSSVRRRPPAGCCSGTVAGDIHDLGKNMASMTFRAFGFAVEDLGVNVPPEDFLEAARRSKPDIIGMSGLLTLAFDSMRDTVELLREHEERAGVSRSIVIGGSTIDEHVAAWVGADHWTNDAMEGVAHLPTTARNKTRSERS